MCAYRCNHVEWKSIEREQFEAIPRLGSERSLPEFGHDFAAAEWSDFELLNLHKYQIAKASADIRMRTFEGCLTASQ
jgi:hypothetical protein